MSFEYFRFNPGCSQTPKLNSIEPSHRNPINVAMIEHELYHGPYEGILDSETEETEEIYTPENTINVIPKINIRLFLEVLKLKVKQKVTSETQSLTNEIKQKVSDTLPEIQENTSRSIPAHFYEENQTTKEEVSLILERIEDLIKRPVFGLWIKSLQKMLKDSRMTGWHYSKYYSDKEVNRFYNKLNKHKAFNSLGLDGYDRDDLESNIFYIVKYLSEISEFITLDQYVPESKRKLEIKNKTLLTDAKRYIAAHDILFIDLLMLNHVELTKVKINGKGLITLGKNLGIEEPHLINSIYSLLQCIFETTVSDEINRFTSRFSTYLHENNIDSFIKFKDHDFTQFHPTLNKIMKIKSCFEGTENSKLSLNALWRLIVQNQLAPYKG